MSLPAVPLAELAAAPARRRFAFPATRTVEYLRDGSGMVAGLIVRTQDPLEGCDRSSALEESQDGLFRIACASRTTRRSQRPGTGPRRRAAAIAGLGAHHPSV